MYNVIKVRIIHEKIIQVNHTWTLCSSTTSTFMSLFMRALWHVINLLCTTLVSARYLRLLIFYFGPLLSDRGGAILKPFLPPSLYNQPLSRTIGIGLRELASERYLALRQETNFAVDRRCVCYFTRRLGGKKWLVSRTVINSQSPRFLTFIICIERRDFYLLRGKSQSLSIYFPDS